MATKSPTLPGPGRRFMAWLKDSWQRLTEASPHLVEPDQRRQAQLLASMLVVIIPLLLLSEVATILTFLGREPYSGYLIALGSVAVFSAAYVYSRTAHHRRGALLFIVTASVTIFVYAASVPEAVPGGFLDWVLLPLLLASAFLSIPQLLLFGLANLGGLILFPLFFPVVSFDAIVLGPLSFFILTSAVVLVLTHHRDQLERDRATRLQREATRTASLLRVAERLNSLLDLDTVLTTMAEEIAQALTADAAVVFIYDIARAELTPAASYGLPAGQALPAAIPRAVHDQVVAAVGPVAALPDSPARAGFPGVAAFGVPATSRLVHVALAYNGRLVGSLFVIRHSAMHRLADDDRLLLRGLADQAALAIVNTRLYKDARRRLEQLQALRTIDIAITSNSGIQDTLNVLLEQITHQLSVDAAVVLLLDTTQRRLLFAAGRGLRTLALGTTRLRLGEGHAGQVALQRSLLFVPDLRAKPGAFGSPLFDEEQFVSYVAAPLIAKDEVSGVLEVFHRAPLAPDPEWLAFMEALAGQAAIAIDNTTLLTDLQHSNADLAQAYDATIEGWSHALDLRDKETEGHTLRVTEMTLALARQMGVFDEAELVHLRRGALLHDIGKMGVPDSILLKPGPLTDAEWVIMRRHPTQAYEMLLPIEYLRFALDIPYAHHEKWDGSGYPRGLKGEEIPLAARVFAVADIWDALHSDRPYRPAWPEAKIRAHLAELAGTHLDPHIVAAFLGMLGDHET